MLYQVGDVVLIRDWDDMLFDYGLTHKGEIDCYGNFNRKQKPYCGKTITIDYVYPEYNLYQSKSDNLEFYWSDDMIVRKVKDKDGNTSFPIKYLSFGEVQAREQEKFREKWERKYSMPPLPFDPFKHPKEHIECAWYEVDQDGMAVRKLDRR